MSTALRRLLSLVVVAVVVGIGAWVYLGQSDSSAGPHQSTAAPGPVQVDEDTADLEALKARAGIETCTPGAAASRLPKVTLPCLGGGRSVDLASLKGPMLLSFWQAGCGPCKKEMPALQAFDDKYGTRVPVLGVDFLDLYPGTALQLMQKRGVTYPSLADPGGDLQKTSTFAKIPGMPMLYFIDAQGRVSYAHPGGVTSEAQVADLVRQHLGIDL